MKPSKPTRPKLLGWFEEYRCGCVSDTAKRKRDLLGYCGKHGDSARRTLPDFDTKTKDAK